jgi:hypothetical protein
MKDNKKLNSDRNLNGASQGDEHVLQSWQLKLHPSSLKTIHSLRLSSPEIFPVYEPSRIPAKELLKNIMYRAGRHLHAGTVHEAEEAYRPNKNSIRSPSLLQVVKAQIHVRWTVVREQ